MGRGTALSVLALLAGFVALVWLYVKRQNSSQPVANHEDRIPKLKKLVSNQEEESAQAVASYQPKVLGRIDDLDISVVDLLRQLPGVAQVKVGVQAEKPKYRIVHLRDWHFVPIDLYAIWKSSSNPGSPANLVQRALSLRPATNRVVCSDRMDYARSQQTQPGPTIHLSFYHLQPIHLAFDRPIAPPRR